MKEYTKEVAVFQLEVMKVCVWIPAHHTDFEYYPLPEKQHFSTYSFLLFKLKFVYILTVTANTIINPIKLIVLVSLWRSIDVVIFHYCSPIIFSSSNLHFSIKFFWFSNLTNNLFLQLLCWAAPMQGSPGGESAFCTVCIAVFLCPFFLWVMSLLLKLFYSD